MGEACQGSVQSYWDAASTRVMVADKAPDLPESPKAASLEVPDAAQHVSGEDAMPPLAALKLRDDLSSCGGVIKPTPDRWAKALLFSGEERVGKV